MAVATRTLVWGLAAAALLSGCGEKAPRPAPLAGKPQRIMSLSVCTDLLLLQLVPKARIASVSFLAHQRVEVIMPGADEGVAVNRALAEDIIQQKPDLIIGSRYSTPQTRSIAKRAGARVVEFDEASDFAGVAALVRQAGAAVGEPERAEALVAEMNAKLARLEETGPKTAYSVVAWNGGDWVPGQGTLSNAIIEAAGARNIAAKPGFRSTNFSVEQLLADPPDALMYGSDIDHLPSLHQDQGQHRVVRKLYAGRTVTYDEGPHLCGLPQSADAAVDLRRKLDALPRRRS